MQGPAALRPRGPSLRGWVGASGLTESSPWPCFPGCSDLHLLDMLTPTERKRQGYIHELIVTEENYVNDLQLVTEVTVAMGAWGGPWLRVGAGGETWVLDPSLRSFRMLGACLDGKVLGRVLSSPRGGGGTLSCGRL